MKREKMPGLYLFVAPVDKNVRFPITDSGVPHITVAYTSSDDQLEKLRACASACATLEGICTSEITLDSVATSVFTKDGRERRDILLNVCERDAVSIATLRTAFDPAKFVMRTPHVTYSTEYGPSAAPPALPAMPLKVRVIGIGLYTR